MHFKRPAFTVVELLVVIVIIGLVIAFLLPSVRSSREASRRNQCLNNLKQIALSVLNYEDVNGALPAACVVDAEGAPLHSWRTQVLPQAEHSGLFGKIDLSKPWDDPANSEASGTLVEFYLCPSVVEETTATTYLGVVGPDGTFSHSTPRRLVDISDEFAETVFVIDVATDKAVPWAAPRDLGADEVLKHVPTMQTRHLGVFQTAFLDGHVAAVSGDVDHDTLRAMVTIAGGETLSE